MQKLSNESIPMTNKNHKIAKRISMQWTLVMVKPKQPES